MDSGLRSPFGYFELCCCEHGIRISFEALFSILFWYIPRSGVAGSYGNSIFNFLRNHQTVFYSSSTTSHSHHSIQGFQFLHILDSLVIFFFFFFFFWTVTILVNVCWYLTVVLICISLMVGEVEHFFTCTLAICISSLEQCLFTSAPFLLR